MRRQAAATEQRAGHPIGMAPSSDALERIRLAVETSRLDLVLSQVETAYTLALTAQTFHRSGSVENAERVQQKAWELYDSAVRLLEQQLSFEKHVRDHLTHKLTRTRAILDSFLNPR
jgi:hypothetical protein